jgi:hypothetical protein
VASLRGGGWNNNPRNLRASNRNRNEPANQNDNIGFRCAQSSRRRGMPPVGARLGRARFRWDRRPAGGPTGRGREVRAGGRRGPRGRNGARPPYLSLGETGVLLAPAERPRRHAERAARPQRPRLRDHPPIEPPLAQRSTSPSRRGGEGRGSVGKWFYTTLADARRWAPKLYRGAAYVIAEIRFPAVVVESAHRDDRLEGDTPALFLEPAVFGDIIATVVYRSQP